MYEGIVYGNVSKGEAIRCETIIIETLDKYEKIDELLQEIIIQADEDGLEPTSLTQKKGAEITKEWAKRYRKIVGEQHD